MSRSIKIQYSAADDAKCRIAMTVDLDQLLDRHKLAEGRAIVIRSSGKTGNLELKFTNGK